MFTVFPVLSGALLLVIISKTLLFKSRQTKVSSVEPVAIEQDPLLERFAQAIQFPTISTQDEDRFDPQPFLEFHRFLEASFPHLHQSMTREVINDYSLLYKWQGSDGSLKPIIFLAHMDVVPIEPGTEEDWSHEPFSGDIAEGFIWGRGSMDMKGTLVGLMEAAERLIQMDFQPRRTLYFAFGHDEEIGGTQGAARISAHLKKQGVQAAFTVDEGMVILKENYSPLGKQVAVIGLAEKGYVTLKITAKTSGGHSSVPPEKTTVGALAKAITRLEQNQFKASLAGISGLMFDYMAPEMPFFKKLLFANRWLFGGPILNRLTKNNALNALVRTTTAPTIIQGGVKENVLPSQAYALVNFRIMPGSTVAEVVSHARRVINDDAIEITIHGRANGEPSTVSSDQSEGYCAIRDTIYQLFPGTIVAPGLVMGGTDSKHYASITDDSYRFSPDRYGPDDPGRIHGTNERVCVNDYVKSIQFYCQFLKTCGEAEPK